MTTRFKKWFQQNESLAGPGGGPNPTADSPEAMGAADAVKGVGAHPQYNKEDEPPVNKNTPTSKYLDKSFYTKLMKKKMKKH